ncbi:MAG: heparan-alpha-glucosaminide N-acetyltransferase domain-containing protein [Coriobacteriia bacterium]
MPEADNPDVLTTPERRSVRLISLDVFRAITVIGMIFMDHPTIREAVPQWLLHPEWHGFRLADTIFSSFLFIAGVSMAFSSAKPSRDPKAERRAFFKRVGLLILFGLALNLVKYGVPVRILGVLQRIALASLIAWPFRRKSPWMALGTGLALITAHTVVSLFVGAPGVPVGYLDGIHNIAGWIDTLIVGVTHTYKGQGFDPEGFLGTLTAASVMLWGLAAGMWLRRDPQDRRTIARLTAGGVAALGAGLVLALAVPVNKKLGTGSFTLLMWGIDIVVLMALHWIADVRGHTKALKPLVPLGLNALAIYVGFNALLGIATNVRVTTPGGTDITLLRAVGAVGERILGDPTAATLLISGAEVIAWLAVATYLDRRKVYFKL